MVPLRIIPHGVCLGFEPSIEAIDFACAYPVIYRDERPTINLIRRSVGAELLDKLLLTKASGWSYEREWRMVAQDIRTRLRSFPPQTLREVILGARINSFDRTTILEAIQKSPSKPEIFQAKASTTEFKMLLEPYSAT